MAIPDGIKRELLQAAMRTGTTPQLDRTLGWLMALFNHHNPYAFELFFGKAYRNMDGVLDTNLLDTEEIVSYASTCNTESTTT